jgi:hypothetical protein
MQHQFIVCSTCAGAAAINLALRMQQQHHTYRVSQVHAELLSVLVHKRPPQAQARQQQHVVHQPQPYANAAQVLAQSLVKPATPAPARCLHETCQLDDVEQHDAAS